MEIILVTGGCGFIGSNFIRYLLEETGFKGFVVNVDKLTYAGNRDNLLDMEANYRDRYAFVKADIRDLRRMAEVFEEHEIDTVCHFAAESHVDRSIVGPDAFVQTNVIGTFTLLEAARGIGSRLHLFHHVSTDEVFGSLGEEGYFTEETAYSPNSPYSASKAGSDHLVRAYHKTYGMPVTVSNCSNNYGPYQFPEKLIPLTILNAMEGRTLPVYGDGRNVRDWLYVRDHCAAVWKIMEEGVRGDTYNVGGDTELENIRLVEIICDILDEKLERKGDSSCRRLIRFVQDRPGHDQRYAVDFAKMRGELGWRPRESFQSGIRKTIDWYLNHREWVERVQSGEYQAWMRMQYH